MRAGAGSGESALPCEPSQSPQELSGGFSGKIDGIFADFLHDGWPILAQTRKLALGNLGDAGVVTRPTAHQVSESVDLSAPVRVVRIDIGGPHDEKVDVAARIPVAASCAAKQRGVNRWNLPGVDLIPKPPNQLSSYTGHPLNGRGQKVVAVQLVEKSAANLLAADEPMLDEAVKDVLNAGVGAPCTTGKLTAAAGLGGTCQRH